MPKVSVIIPCFNHGKYINAAVESVLGQTYNDFEIIIIDDGSTDKFTKKFLANYKRPKTKIIITQNQGLASARNTGIRNAKGKYILPLDADDKIAPTYIEKAVEVIENNKNIGIVYCLAETFGYKKGSWYIPEFTQKRMLLRNLIFCSALFKKQDWESVGGYNTKMIRSWEDWDFWLSLISIGCEVYRIPEVLFYYRLTEGSMITTMSRQEQVAMHMQLMRNHKDIFIENSQPLVEFYYRITMSRAYKSIKFMLGKSALKRPKSKRSNS
jgi:glycosyltransferase involved in cell wall biosynthesis